MSDEPKPPATGRDKSADELVNDALGRVTLIITDVAPLEYSYIDSDPGPGEIGDSLNLSPTNLAEWWALPAHIRPYINIGHNWGEVAPNGDSL
jgi:hypothetical protein